jgi:hypothetical protein
MSSSSTFQSTQLDARVINTLCAALRASIESRDTVRSAILSGALFPEARSAPIAALGGAAVVFSREGGDAARTALARGLRASIVADLSVAARRSPPVEDLEDLFCAVPVHASAIINNNKDGDDGADKDKDDDGDDGAEKDKDDDGGEEEGKNSDNSDVDAAVKKQKPTQGDVSSKPLSNITKQAAKRTWSRITLAAAGRASIAARGLARALLSYPDATPTPTLSKAAIFALAQGVLTHDPWLRALAASAALAEREELLKGEEEEEVVGDDDSEQQEDLGGGGVGASATYFDTHHDSDDLAVQPGRKRARVEGKHHHRRTTPGTVTPGTAPLIAPTLPTTLAATAAAAAAVIIPKPTHAALAESASKLFRDAELHLSVAFSIIMRALNRSFIRDNNNKEEVEEEGSGDVTITSTMMGKRIVWADALTPIIHLYVALLKISGRFSESRKFALDFTSAVLGTKTITPLLVQTEIGSGGGGEDLDDND